MQAHNLKVFSSNLAPATNLPPPAKTNVTGGSSLLILPTPISPKIGLSYFVLRFCEPQYALYRFSRDSLRQQLIRG